MTIARLTSTELIMRAKQLIESDRVDHRDKMLEVGETLFKYLVERMRESESATKWQTQKEKLTRERFVADACGVVGLTPCYARDLIATSQAVKFLRPSGGLGSLSLSSVRCFRTCLRRKSIDKPEPNNQRKLQEEWEVKPALVEQAPALLAEAVQESWRYDRVKEAVEALTLGHNRSKRRRVDHGKIEDPKVLTAKKLREMVSAGSTKDVADMLLDMVYSSKDPTAVMRQLRLLFDQNQAARQTKSANA